MAEVTVANGTTTPAADTSPEVNWHASGELAVDFAILNPRYVAVESRMPHEGVAWATIRSAPKLALWLSSQTVGECRVLWPVA